MLLLLLRVDLEIGLEKRRVPVKTKTKTPSRTPARLTRANRVVNRNMSPGWL